MPGTTRRRRPRTERELAVLALKLAAGAVGAAIAAIPGAIAACQYLHLG